MPKLDLKKTHRDLYYPPSKEVVFVDVPQFQYLMIDGEGDPSTAPAFHDAIATLYPVAYAIKFLNKKETLHPDYVMMPLEGLWWAENMEAFATGERSAWKWTLLILQPDFISAEMVDEAMDRIAEKKDLPLIAHLRFECLHEGMSAQIMHIGPFSDEGATVERLHAFIERNGFSLRGKHHEIYLSDIRRVAPEKLKTVLRQPVHPLAGKE